MPMPVAERSKAIVCGRSLAGIGGLNPAGTSAFSRCCVCCQVQVPGTSFISSIGVLSTVLVTVCNLETSRLRRPRPELGCCDREKSY